MDKSVGKAITLIHYNRPEYSKQCLTYLSKCINFEQYTLINCCEPGNKKVLSIVDKFCEKYKNSKMFINEAKLGFNKNKLRSLQIGFNIAEMVVDLDDDILLYKDSLQFCETHFDKINLDENTLNISLAERKHEHVKDFYERRKNWGVRRWFCPWGICLNRQSFDFLLSKDVFSHGDKTFDVCTNELGLSEIYPSIGRSQNIGSLDGAHAGVYGPEWHLENHYSPIWMGTYEYHDFEKPN